MCFVARWEPVLRTSERSANDQQQQTTPNKKHKNNTTPALIMRFGYMRFGFCRFVNCRSFAARLGREGSRFQFPGQPFALRFRRVPARSRRAKRNDGPSPLFPDFCKPPWMSKVLQGHFPWTQCVGGRRGETQQARVFPKAALGIVTAIIHLARIELATFSV